MPRLTSSVPRYRRHKASGQAVVHIAGKDHYLGPHGTEVSKLEYDRIVGEWLASGRPNEKAGEQRDRTVVEVLAGYKRFAESYYRKDGKLTGAMDGIYVVIDWLNKYYGRTKAIEFGPLALKAMRQRFIDAGHSRRYINDNVQRICRIFRWAVSEELIPPDTLEALRSVPGLRRGRSEAREATPIKPVSDAAVEATLPHLPEVVADMTRFQRLTGCRPGEVCLVRPCDVDTSEEVWAFRPESHKTEHHGRDRIIFVGPQAQNVLRKYLLRAADAYCFSPADTVKKGNESRRARRRSPLTPSQRKRKPKATPKRKPGFRYTTDSYRRAIQRACERAEIQSWSPNQLRHTAATEIRKEFGLEAAQVALGHASADVSQIYAERDSAKAKEVMRLIG